jgi:hypothetical protein
MSPLDAWNRLLREPLVNHPAPLSGARHAPESADRDARKEYQMLHLRQLLRRYAEYRRVGYGRLAAFRFAWLVVTPRKPLSAR